MRLVKLGLASVNTTVGAFSTNVDRCLKLAREMEAQGVTIAVFPEQVVSGYAPEDLVQWHDYIERQWEELARFAHQTAASGMISVLGVTVAHQGLRYNCAALVAGGHLYGLVPKEKLPNYNIFYEGRTFARGTPGLRVELSRVPGGSTVPMGDLLFGFEFGTVALEVCEDVWSADGPMRRRCYSGAELVLNVSASPFRVGVDATRKEMLATRSSDHQCTLAYTNLVGANDGLIFDGGAHVFQNGKPMLEAPRFVEGWAACTVDLNRTARLRTENTTWRDDREVWLRNAKPAEVIDVRVDRNRESLAYPTPPHKSFFMPAERQRPSVREEWCEELLSALALGVGDYFEKTKGFKKIGIALSGGRDSLLTLLIAHRYAAKVKPKNPGELIETFYMPTRYSSEHTRNAAETIARELGVRFTVLSIDEAFERELEATKAMLKAGEEITPVTKQNIQARLRAQRMWNWANSSGGLFLQTGNMSEKAVGYTTIGGDLMGALAVIANLPKTVVMVLLEYLHQKHGYEGIKAVTARPAGPELAPNQVGEDELMPFPILDACFHLFAGEKLSPGELAPVLAQMFPDVPAATLAAHVQKFVKLFTQSIYKWVQSPLSLHVGNLDLDRERALQLPVVTRLEW
jgi:NAD+ synthase (glutamine-hydrolysing)